MTFSRHLCVLSFAFAALLSLLGGCTSTGSSSSSERNPIIPMSASSALLREGDSLVITLLGIPTQESYSMQVDEQGLVSLPYIGNVKATGRTTSDLGQHIRDTYITKKLYTRVDVSVSVTERYIYVGGEVQQPGRVQWTPDLTVAKAIQSAGGFSLYAKEDAVTLVRDRKAYAIDVNLAQKNPREDPRMFPGDSLQVSRSAF